MFNRSNTSLIVMAALVLVALSLTGCGAGTEMKQETNIDVGASPTPAVTPPAPATPKPIIRVRTVWVEQATSYDNYAVPDGGFTDAYAQKIRFDVPSGTYLGRTWVCVKDEGSHAAPVIVTASTYDGGYITNGGRYEEVGLVNGKGKISLDTSGFFNEIVAPEFFMYLYARVAHGAPRTGAQLVIDRTNVDCETTGPNGERSNTGFKFFGTAVDQDVVVMPSNAATFVPSATPPAGGKGKMALNKAGS